MFGAAMNDSRPRRALQMRWPLLTSLVMPLIITGSSAIQPPAEHRKAVCAVVMPLTAVIVVVVAVLVLLQSPFRSKFENLHWPLSLLWIALTALFSQPAVVDGLGKDTVVTILAVISLLQSITLVVVVVQSCLVFVFVDRRCAELFDRSAATDGTDDDDDDTKEGGSSSSSGVVMLMDLDAMLFLDDDEDEESNAIELEESVDNNVDEVIFSDSFQEQHTCSSRSSVDSADGRLDRDAFLKNNDDGIGDDVTDLLLQYQAVDILNSAVVSEGIEGGQRLTTTTEE